MTLRTRATVRHDVVFYAPWVGSILSNATLPPPGGAETQVLSLARTLVRHGASVAIVAYGGVDELPKSVDGVSIVTRPRHCKKARFTGKIVETFHIWRALWLTPSR